MNDSMPAARRRRRVDRFRTGERSRARLLAAPVDPPLATDRTELHGVVIGTLVGFADDGATPLVTYSRPAGERRRPGAGDASDLHGAHIGRRW